MKILSARVVARAAFWMSSPVVAIAFPASYVLALFLLGLVTPVNDISGASTVYLFGGLAAMAVLAWIGQRSARQRPARMAGAHGVSQPDSHWRRSLRLVYLLAASGTLFLVADLVLSFASNPAVLSDPVAMRITFLDRESTLFAYPGNALYPFTLVALGLVIVYFERMRWPERLLGLVVGLLPPIFLSLILAGRQGVVMQVILVAWWCCQRPALGLPLLPRSMPLKMGIAALVVVSACLSSACRHSAALHPTSTNPC